MALNSMTNIKMMFSISRILKETVFFHILKEILVKGLKFLILKRANPKFKRKTNSMTTFFTRKI